MFIPNHTVSLDDDRLMDNKIRQKMENGDKVIWVEEQLLPDEYSALVSECQLLLGTRVHSIIIAALNSVPFIGVTYDPKLLGIGERLGLAQHILRIEELTTEGLIKTIEEVWERQQEIRTFLSLKVIDMQTSIDETTGLLRDICYQSVKRCE